VPPTDASRIVTVRQFGAVLATIGAVVTGCNGSTKAFPASRPTTTSSAPAPARPRPLPPAPWWGVTVDDASDASRADAIVDAARTARESTGSTLFTRIVFDNNAPPSTYAPLVRRLQPVSYLMGELVDSSDIRKLSVAAYAERTKRYLAALRGSIDLWEVGNEVNGDWTGPSSAVVAKVSNAYDQVQVAGLRSALTVYYNPGCSETRSRDMFTWITAELPARIKRGLDVVLVSYYEDDCNGLQPSTQQWQNVFDRLHAIFPKAKLGFGETGTHDDASVTHKRETMQRYYGLRIRGDNYVGGYFWWYYAEDCLPAGRSLLWPTLMWVMRATP